jgi:hypothetical protein
MYPHLGAAIVKEQVKTLVSDRRTGKIDYHSVYPPWPNPVQLRALGKLVRENLCDPCFRGIHRVRWRGLYHHHQRSEA